MKKNTKNKSKKTKNIALALAATGAISAPFVINSALNKETNISQNSLILSTNKSMENNYDLATFSQQSEIEPGSYNSLISQRNRYYQVTSIVEEIINDGLWASPNKDFNENLVYTTEQKGDNDSQDARDWAYGRSKITLADWRARGREVIYWPTLKRFSSESQRDILTGDGSATYESSSVEVINKPSQTVRNGELVIHLDDFDSSKFYVRIVNITDHPVASVIATNNKITIKNYSNSENGLRVMLSPRNYTQKAVSRGTREDVELPNNINQVIVLTAPLINRDDFQAEPNNNLRFSIHQDANSKLLLASEDEANELVKNLTSMDTQTKNIINKIASTNSQTNVDWVRETKLHSFTMSNPSIKYVGKNNDYSYYLYSIGDDNEKFYKLLRINNTDSRIGISSMTDDEKQAFVKPYDFHIYTSNMPLNNYISTLDWEMTSNAIKNIMFTSFEAAKIKLRELKLFSETSNYVYDETKESILNNLEEINKINDIVNKIESGELSGDTIGLDLKVRLLVMNIENKRSFGPFSINNSLILDETETIFREILKNFNLFFNALNHFKNVHNQFLDWKSNKYEKHLSTFESQSLGDSNEVVFRDLDVFKLDHTLIDELTFETRDERNTYHYTYDQIEDISKLATFLNGTIEESSGITLEDIQQLKDDLKYIKTSHPELLARVNEIIDLNTFS